MQRSFLIEETIERKVAKKIRKDGYALFKNDGIEAHITYIDGDIAYGLTNLDDDIEIDLNNPGEWVLDEGTVSSDIAQSAIPMIKQRHKRKCKKKKDAQNESAVGLVGRTGIQDAKNHISDELRKEFRRIVKALGGKTVARQLLAEMNAGL